jgi:hypothetical protein
MGLAFLDPRSPCLIKFRCGSTTQNKTSKKITVLFVRSLAQSFIQTHMSQDCFLVSLLPTVFSLLGAGYTGT